ncbi:Type 1 glutamine amidotransferase-like domain-containing protein [Deinococcus cellulosilyticus]|uniref:Dipeptidase E n=1 Tax=Deinococcus cellulosilyticus (strain DSM 18568 / NBRC 106333 / KACC 11606 / 5516J-15) TaxID=1223518 RepID=A0A511N470_DEIC1|nr:Type 1 glutamine amidotransferase-like domain-containing protein [Deinococcus cellulosilyticus]GEM47670.1 hypothetical protein DC3_33050 [Deinococcus cellulosilyticus NBRC 106333 = KACC 11606]
MHLFLLGNTPALPRVVQDFMALAGNEARIAVLCAGANWPRYAPHYLQTFLEAGAQEVRFIGEEDGVLNLEQATEILQSATGILVAGGDTYLYQQHYVVSNLADLIREKVRSGVPYIGISAGAILSCLTCLIPEEDRSGPEQPRYLPGFGFLTTLVFPHFSEWEGQAELQAAAQELYVQEAWGLDENAAACFQDGELVHTYGEGVWKVGPEGEPELLKVEAPILLG